MDDFNQALEIEDYLQEKDVFVNGLTDVSSSIDSYLTVIAFNKLEEVLQVTKFKKEQWASAVRYWKETELPITVLLSKIITRKLLG